MPTTTYKFTVDARLLRELGERLVGRPHIALAELVKNAYDADARTVEIAFDSARIVVTDDGHGMSPDDFLAKWMRVGTTHKERARVSPGLGRPMTGSKGVGRLAVQLLARRTRVTSVGLIHPARNRAPVKTRSAAALSEQIDARINWDAAISSGDLTGVSVPVQLDVAEERFAGGSPHGTRVELTQLVHQWDAVRFRRLAQEIWSLQPPFDVPDDDPNAFKIVLTTGYRETFRRFDTQMRALMDIWSARITGRLRPIDEGDPSESRDVIDLPHTLPSRVNADEIEESEDIEDSANEETLNSDQFIGTDGDELTSSEPPAPLPTRYLEVTVELRDLNTATVTWRVPDCQLEEVEFDIRVFDLQNRQPENIKVGVAREYLRRFGGVGVYDSGFRLPYYGADLDWLAIERTHAARLSASQLLPKSLMVERGLHDLPSNRRLFGQVFISTSREAAQHATAEGVGPDVLAVQVTRDRLVDNAAYQRLRVMARAALDAYAMEQARTKLVKARGRRMGSGRQPSASFSEIRSAIQEARPTLPATTFKDLERAVARAVEEAEVLEEVSRAHAALLGALATAGITSLAYEHEISKQVTTIKDLANELDGVIASIPNTAQQTVATAVAEMRDWVTRAMGIRSILAPLMDEETRTARDRFGVQSLANLVASQVRVLSRDIPIDTSKVPSKLRLPLGTAPAWSAVFQNLYINSFNALLETAAPQIDLDGGGSDANGWVRIQDNGVGVNISEGDRLWEPFERGRPLRPDVAALGLGGTGLGLTIVRMITDELGARVSFTAPDSAYSTAVTISWESGK